MTAVLPVLGPVDAGVNLFTEVVRPDRLSETELERLVDQLHPVHRQVFDAVDRKRFCARAIQSPGSESRLYVIRNREFDTVGYAAIQYSTLRVDRRQVILADYETGLLPGYRRERLMQRLLATELLRLKLSRPVGRLYLAYNVINPIVYGFLADNLRSIYPNPYGPTPWRMRRLLPPLDRYFRGRPQPSASERAHRTDWIVKTSVEDEDRIRRSHRPAIRYFLRMNPRWREGRGLPVVVPLQFGDTLLNLGLLMRSLTPPRPQP